MAGRPKRRRLNPNEIRTSPIASDDSIGTAEIDKARWHGFCEVESEPVSEWWSIISFGWETNLE